LVTVADKRALPSEKEIEHHFEELEALELISIGRMGLADAVRATIPMPLFVMTSLLLGGMLGAKMIQRVFHWATNTVGERERC
jgi:hypothetical protein